MYNSKNAWQGLEGVAADILLNISLKNPTEDNIFIISEKVRAQLEGQKNEILKILDSCKDRQDLKNKISSLELSNGF